MYRTISATPDCISLPPEKLVRGGSLALWRVHDLASSRTDDSLP
jgi:hypothetical protein